MWNVKSFLKTTLYMRAEGAGGGGGCDCPVVDAILWIMNPL